MAPSTEALAMLRTYIRSVRTSPLTPKQATTLRRHLSTTSPRLTIAKPIKARVLEKPDKFRPPSHPARLRKPNAYTTPPLAETERQAQRTRQYPHMMPPEGSAMHGFLTSRWIHTWITLSVLVGLTTTVVITNFLHTTPYRNLLPPNNMFLSHPLQFLGRWAEVYMMHTEYITEQTMAKREAKAEDVKKRAEYRKAHGLEQGGGLAGWTTREEEPGKVVMAEMESEDAQSPVFDGQAPAAAAGEGGEYTDFDGQKRKVKKWFGIW